MPEFMPPTQKRAATTEQVTSTDLGRQCSQAPMLGCVLRGTVAGADFSNAHLCYEPTSASAASKPREHLS